MDNVAREIHLASSNSTMYNVSLKMSLISKKNQEVYFVQISAFQKGS